MTCYSANRKDEAIEKRVELHCHTNMSFKDGVATAEEIIMQAHKFGHKAVAVTDHGSVRAYPEIANAVERLRRVGENIKPIYGIELYLINDVDNDISDLTEKEIISKKTHLVVLVKNQAGLKSLYKIMSEAEYFLKWNEAPVIKRSALDEYRKDFIVGSACEYGELYQAIVAGKSDTEISRIASYYDYLEIHPLENNKLIIKTSDEPDVLEQYSIDVIYNFNRKVIEIADRLGKPVVATGNVHFIEPEDSLVRKILMANQGYAFFEEQAPLYFRTTDEMLMEFSYLGKDKAYEIVVKNTNLISDMVEEILPLQEEYYPFAIKNADKDLEKLCKKKANELYSTEGLLPHIVKERLDTELHHIIYNDFSSHYMIAYLVVKHLKEQGYYAFARGVSGASFVAYLLEFSDVNPLEPHYLCPECHHTEFIDDYSVYSGFDLPHKTCPECNCAMKSDGHNIPYEMLMGFHGEKEPAIDLNIPASARDKVETFFINFFGKERVAHAGTVCPTSPLTAEGYIRNYEELIGTTITHDRREYITRKLCKAHKGSGLHPGKLLILPEGKDFSDFTPCCLINNINYPIPQKTAFDFKHLYSMMNLDLLDYTVLDNLKLLEEYTGKTPFDVDIKDPEIYKLFRNESALGVAVEDIGGTSLGTLCLPEFNSNFMREMLIKTQPKNFTDLVKINGLAHGTGVWENNAEDLIDSKRHTLRELIAVRSDVMLDLMKNGIDKATAYRFNEIVRKGFLSKSRLSDEEIEKFKEITKPLGDWYFDCCLKIRYMFPKAHVVACVINALRLAWFKVYYPAEFYAAYFSVYFKGSEFNINVLSNGLDGIDRYLNKMKNIKGEESVGYRNIYDAMTVAKECIARGINFLPSDIEKSDLDNYIPEDGNIRIPLQ